MFLDLILLLTKSPAVPGKTLLINNVHRDKNMHGLKSNSTTIAESIIHDTIPFICRDALIMRERVTD